MNNLANQKYEAGARLTSYIVKKFGITPYCISHREYGISIQGYYDHKIVENLIEIGFKAEVLKNGMVSLEKDKSRVSITFSK